MPKLRPFKVRLALALCLALVGTALGADERQRLGWSIAVSNDVLGRLYRDRWQSSSIQGSVFTGPAWTGIAPAGYGDMLEYRFRSDILTPENLTSPSLNDRRHAGVLSFGVHTHVRRRGLDIRLGGDIVMVGPQTNLLSIQRDVHRTLGFVVPTLDNFQIPNSLTPQISGEVARVFGGDRLAVRPFAEAQIGPEDFVRLGVDLTFGQLASGHQRVRTAATGHRVPVVGPGQNGPSIVAGLDAAWVEDSIYLPEGLGYDLTPLRTRVRLGAHYDFGRFDAFYGVAYLGEEFEAQREGQMVGTIQLRFAF